MAKNERVQEIMEQLTEGVKNVFEDGEFQKYLTCMSKFHNYSFNNVMLIVSQMPDASLVAGYQAWKQKFNRQVKKGEKAIQILAPVPHKMTREIKKGDKIEEEEVTWITYRTVSVFDVSQTDGDELPTAGQFCRVLDDKVEGYDELYGRLEKISPVPVEFEDINDGSLGYYDPMKKRIALKTGMGESQTVKTMVHEISHSMLHGEDGEEKRAGRTTKEVQAEAVAYTVCSFLGLDVGDYSFGYIAGWSQGRDAKELQNSMETIRKTAEKIIGGITA